MSTGVVGRERELELLGKQFAAARAGRGAAVAVIGEPGIGKTTLVATLADLARAESALVLWGRCAGLGSQVAWEPIAHALGALLDGGALDPAIVQTCGGALLAVLPEAASLAPALSPPAGANPETIAFAVARATTRLLRQLCLKQPVVLVIDDVHDADQPTLRLLVRLAQEARTMPLLVAMTAREGELAASRHATEIADLSRDLTTIRVGALDRAAASSLIQRIAPTLEQPVVERVLTTAEGNPLYLGELAALLAARTSSADETVPIPLGIKASIRSRLERLPADARRFVEALAVLGGHAALERAARVAGVEPAAATIVLEVGLANAAGAIVRISHALVREVAYAELPAQRREAFHRAAAQLAEERAERGDHDAAVERVRHLAACGATADAIDTAIAVAHHAELRAADDEAVAILDVATSAAERAPADDARHARLAIALGRAQLRSGRSEAGIASCVRASEIAERIADIDLIANAALARGSVFRYGHVDRGLVEALRGALVARPDREDGIHARLVARLAGAEQPSTEPWTQIGAAHRAFALARRLGDDRVLLHVLHDGASALIDIEDPRIRLPINSELRDVARRLRSPWYELRALSRLVYDHADLGDPRGVEQVIEELDTVARSFAHPRHQWRVSLLRSVRAVWEGRWAASDRHVDDAIALGGDDPTQAIALFGHRFAKLRAQERNADALQLLEDEGDLLAKIPEAAALRATMEAGVRARLGDLDRARALLGPARPSLVFDDTGFLSWFGEAAAAVGDRDACAAVEPKLVARVHRFANGGPMLMYVADPIERYLGLVAAALGDQSRAIAHLESALERLRAAGAHPYLARTLLDLAGLLVIGTAGERDRANALTGEAIELAERFELADLRDRNLARPAAVPSLPIATGFTLMREGEAWAISSRGKTFRLRDLRGLQILARLIERPGDDIHVLDLIDGDGTIDRGDGGELLDARTRSEYRARLVDLREDLADAERRGDLGWIDRLQMEIETIQAELSRAFARGGRARRSGVAAERARSAVTRRVREAIAKIGEHDPPLGEHLGWAVRTGMTCSYRGNPK